MSGSQKIVPLISNDLFYVKRIEELVGNRCKVSYFVQFLDELMLLSTADEFTSKSDTSVPDKAVRRSERNVHADSYLDRVLSGQEGAKKRKRSGKGQAPKRPLICIPCKKHFNRRSKLDQHNRLVHNTDVRYSCDGCDKMFSRRDHVIRHVRNGHCPGNAGQTNADAQLSIDADDAPLLAEISMLILFTSFAYGPADATTTSSSLASLKSRIVLPFWYPGCPEKEAVN